MSTIPNLPALSIRQPWAWLILNAGKDIENRTWATKYRGDFLIHASKGCTRKEYREAIKDWVYLFDIPDERVPAFESLSFGGIVGIARLADCVEDSESEWFNGDFGFVLRDVRPLPFTPCKGALGFFTPILGVEQVAPSDSTPPKPRAEVTQAQLF